jgi:Sec-independent protein translocase protein TatA
MNIFGIGITELLIILLIMLVVAGPRRMIRWAYVAGVYSAKLRRMWLQTVDVLQREVDDAGLDVKIPREMPTRQNITRTVAELARPYTKDLEEAAQEVNQPLKSALQETQAAAQQVQSETRAATSLPALTAPEESEHESQQAPASQNGFGAWSDAQHPGKQGK